MSFRGTHLNFFAPLFLDRFAASPFLPGVPESPFLQPRRQNICGVESALLSSPANFFLFKLVSLQANSSSTSHSPRPHPHKHKGTSHHTLLLPPYCAPSAHSLCSATLHLGAPQLHFRLAGWLGFYPGGDMKAGGGGQDCLFLV